MGHSRRGTPRPAAAGLLDDPWPGFLDLLDSDPQAAWEGFYTFAWRLVELRPPAILRTIPEEEREDLLADLVQDFQESEFRLLRTYENAGRPFASWFWKVLRNRALDRMKYMRRRAHEDLSEDLEHLKELGISPETLAELRDIVDHVHAALEAMSPRCQLLLKAAAEGYTAKELQVLLGMDAGDNKKLSDQLRYCRRKLVEELARAGVQVDLDA